LPVGLDMHVRRGPSTLPAMSLELDRPVKPGDDK
jgi:hypothetical protein